MMSENLLVSTVCSLCCISDGTFASCGCIDDLLMLCACVVKLEQLRNTGSRGLEGWVLTQALTL